MIVRNEAIAVTTCLLAMIAGAVAMVPMPAAAQQEKWIQVGTLNCSMGPSIGLVMGARQQARCTYTAGTTGARKSYIGRMERSGADRGIASGSRLRWHVFARTARLAPTGLAGFYAGAEGNAAAESVGPNALLGGSGSISLKPVPTERRIAGNLTFEITTLRLE